MTAPIGSSGTPLFNDPSGLLGATGQSDGLRPQVQSRRVSFQLGPLGIRYATDEVLWSAAASSASSSSSDAAAADAAADAKAEAQAAQAQSTAAQTAAAANPQAQTQTAQAQTQSADFARDLWQARLRDAREAAQTGQGSQQSAQTYGPDGTLAGRAVEKGEQQEAGDGGEEEQSSGQAAAEAFSAPAHLMRRAISAYLAAAQDFQSVRPMLAATA